MTSSMLGTSGGFTVIDAETLYKGNYLFGGGVDSFGRPGRTRITQFSINGAIGLTERFEIFYSLIFGQYSTVNAPHQLSGSLLLNALKQSTVNRGNVYLDNRINSFFPLPGLNVSGALAGGVLPGINRNNGQVVTDPLTGLTKIAFPTASFINEAPFLSRNGWSSGNATFGSKIRLGSIKDEKSKNGDKGSNEDDSVLFSNAIVGYVKVPLNRKNNIFENGQENALFKRGSSSNFDFGIFYATSNYIPFPIFGKKKRIKPILNADCLLLGQEPINKTNKPEMEDDLIEKKDYYTLNVHTNHGYIRNNDFSINGINTIDRRDALVFGYGTDTMLNSSFQAVAELRYERMTGRGTSNLSNYNPLDLTFGVKFYPKGVPGLKQEIDNKPRTKNFFSINFAYRLSLNQGNDFSRIGSSKHNFSVQFNFGNTRVKGKNDTTVEVLDKACLFGKRAELEGLEIDKKRAAVGETITVIPVYKSGESSYKSGYWFVDGMAVEGEKDEDGDETGNLKYKISLKPRPEPYKIRFIVQTRFTQAGESSNYSGRCPCDEKMVDLYVEESDFSIDLTGGNTVSAQREQITELTAKILPDDNETVMLNWTAPPQIRLEGKNNDRTRRAVTPANLSPGEIYQVSVTTNNAKSDVTGLRVNYPPTVELRAADSNQDLQGIKPGDIINLIADASDRDNDGVTCSWRLLGKTPNGDFFERLVAEKTSCGNYSLATAELPIGSYEVLVVAKDSIGDIGESKKLPLDIVPKAASIYFKFDRFDLLPSEKKKLDEEAKWLNEDLNRTIKIRVEGYADPRGSDQYNFRLGCRRACQAKYYLIKEKGIDPNRVIITTVSYGEKYAAGINETSWRKDRRVDLIYTRFSGEFQIKQGERICDDCLNDFRNKGKIIRKRKKR